MKKVPRIGRHEEAHQKTLLLQKFNSQKWLRRLPYQISWAALELLAIHRQKALKMLKDNVPRRCSVSNCTCLIYTQHGLICTSRIADKEEAGLPLIKADVHKVYWLDRGLSLENPLLTVLSPKKVTATKGRPRDTTTFAVDEEGIFANISSRGKVVMGQKTKETTTSLGSRAGDKTRATTASVQRINSAFEHNDTTLQSLDEEDIRGSVARRETVRRNQRLGGRAHRASQPEATLRSAGIVCAGGDTLRPDATS
jgi:hypothetical protein